MADITILNSFLYPIKIFLYYTFKKDPKKYTHMGSFFGNGHFQNITCPENALDIMINIGIKLQNGSLKIVSFPNIDIYPKKYYEFLGSLNSFSLRELNIDDFLKYKNSVNKSSITIKNSLNFSFKCDFSFHMLSLKNFEAKNYTINKNSKITINMPINCYKFSFLFLLTDPSSNITINISKEFDLYKNILTKCYEIIRNELNYSIDIIEDNCVN